MDEIVLDSSESEEIALTQRSRNFLLTTAKWSKFLAIVGFVFIGLMAIGAIVLIGIGSSMRGFGAQGMIMGITYLIMAVLYFFPCYYLILFANKITTGLRYKRQNEVDAGFENLKSTFKFMGIMTIVVLGFYIIMLLFGLLAAAAQGF